MKNNNSLIVVILFVFILSSAVAGGFFYYQDQGTSDACVGAWSEWTECPTRFTNHCATTATRNRTFQVVSGVCDYADGARQEQVCMTREPPADCVPQTTSYGFPVDYPNNMRCETPVTTEEDCRAAAEALNGRFLNDQSGFVNAIQTVKAHHTKIQNSMCVQVNGTSSVGGEILFNEGGQEQKTNSLVHMPPICKFT